MDRFCLRAGFAMARKDHDAARFFVKPRDNQGGLRLVKMEPLHHAGVSCPGAVRRQPWGLVDDEPVVVSKKSVHLSYKNRILMVSATVLSSTDLVGNPYPVTKIPGVTNTDLRP
jgi:hypothetical protein